MEETIRYCVICGGTAEPGRPLLPPKPDGQRWEWLHEDCWRRQSPRSAASELGEVRATEAAPTTPAKTRKEVCRDVRHALVDALSLHMHLRGEIIPPRIESWLMNGSDDVIDKSLAPLFEKGERK